MNTEDSSVLLSDDEVNALAKRLSDRQMPESVYHSMRTQHAQLDLSQKQKENLDLLSRPDTTFVLTGQQIGLFLGPLFTLYKALAAIVTAEEVSRISGVPCVPVFWLQTEDHDFEEIQSLRLMTRDYLPHTIGLASEIHTERSSVEHTRIDSGIGPILEEFSSLYEHLPASEEILSVFRRAYTPDRKLADSFRQSLHDILKQSGILFFNPREVSDGSCLADFFRKQLLEYKEIERVLVSSGEKISDSGGEEQVFVRPNSPLLFFHPDGATGARYRIELESNDVWRFVGRPGTVGTSELLEALATDPLQFSTTALSRPILQSMYFPTLAYIGGDAELRYYKQIEGLFSYFNLCEPAVMPRPHFTILEPKIADWLQALQLSVEEASLPEDIMLGLLAERLDGALISPQVLEEKTREGVIQGLEPMRLAFEQTDATILRSFEKNRDKMLSSIGPLIARYTKALANNDEIRSQRLEKIRGSLLPDNAPQERGYAAASFLCKYGHSFADEIQKHITAFRDIHEVITL